MPKGVMEPFIFRFKFVWGMKYLHPLFEAGPHQVRHLGVPDVHDVVFNYINYIVPDVGLRYLDIATLGPI